MVGDGVVTCLAGIAVRNPGCQFLETDIEDGVGEALREIVALVVLAWAEAPVDYLEAKFLQLDRVDRSGHHQVVAQRDAVPILLGGPTVDPLPPRAVHAHVHRDLAVIRRQVVLGDQVLHHRHLGDIRKLALVGVPILPAERVVVLPVRPRDVVVRVPGLVHAQVPVQVLLDDRFKFVQQLQVGQLG